MRDSIFYSHWLSFLVLATLAVSSAHADQVGTTVLARGAITAQVGSDIRLLGHGTPVFEGDVVTTGRDSFGVFAFQDGTRVMLRPETVFSVERYVSESDKENATLRLYRGGLRAVTGSISKRNPNGFRLHTPNATLDIRGTDFSARVCTADCAKEAKGSQRAQAGADAVIVGRVAFLKGELTVTDNAGAKRKLALGAPLNEGDLVESAADSFAVLAFRDESRITLQANTRFRIEGFRFDEKTPQAGLALFSLFKGGLRAATGLIGKFKRRSYTVVTPVANISVRGTRFDLILRSGRLYVVSREGQLEAWQGRRQVNLPANQTVSLNSVSEPPQVGVTLPPEIINELGPKPEDIDIDPAIFRSAPLANIKPGTLFVDVTNGEVNVKAAHGSGVKVEAGEMATTTDGQVQRVPPQPFVEQDPYLRINPVDVRDDSLPPGVPDPTPQALACKIS